jgi:hypothetical protein
MILKNFAFMLFSTCIYLTKLMKHNLFENYSRIVFFKFDLEMS